MAAIAMQWLEAIASGAEKAHTRTAKSAITVRQRFIATSVTRSGQSEIPCDQGARGATLFPALTIASLDPAHLQRAKPRRILASVMFALARLERPVKMRAALLVVLLAVICFGGVAQALTPSDAMADCTARLCDEQLACGTPVQTQSLPVSHALPIATVPVVGALPTPAPTSAVVAGPLIEPGPDYSLAPLAPRPPPSA